MFNEPTRRCRIRRDGVQENDVRCIYNNGRCKQIGVAPRRRRRRGQELLEPIRRNVNDLAIIDYLNRHDAPIGEYRTYALAIPNPQQLDSTAKLQDMLLLFREARTYAVDNGIRLRPPASTVFTDWIISMRNFILYIPQLREILRGQALGAFNNIGGLRNRLDLIPGTQYHTLNLTSMAIFNKVLHTENALDFGRPEDFPDFLINIIETCFDNLYAYLFFNNGRIMTHIQSINTALTNWTELITTISGGACLENILNMWIEMFQGPVIDLMVNPEQTKVENLARILVSIKNYLCRSAINLNANIRIREDMNLDQKIPIGIDWILNKVNGPDPYSDEEYHIPDNILTILRENNVIGSRVSNGYIELRDVQENINALGPPWGGIPRGDVTDEDRYVIREGCIDAGYWR